VPRTTLRSWIKAVGTTSGRCVTALGVAAGYDTELDRRSNFRLSEEERSTVRLCEEER
jgi:hypothetical protein